MKCPKCGEEMILGTLHSYREIVWRPPNAETPFFIVDNHSSIALTRRTMFNKDLSIQAFHCPSCTLIIADYGHQWV